MKLYHERNMSLPPEKQWTQQDVANVLGVGQKTVSRDLEVSQKTNPAISTNVNSDRGGKPRGTVQLVKLGFRGPLPFYGARPVNVRHGGSPPIQRVYVFRSASVTKARYA